MKLYTAHRAPSPRRVLMFLAEKQISGIELVPVDLNQGEHRRLPELGQNPLSRVPALVLDDGRVLTETRAICTWLEGRWPEPNLMGVDADERAFIEMADRRVEFHLLGTVAQCVRHTHPGLAALEQPQFADYGQAQGHKVLAVARWFDEWLQKHAWMAGERLTVADITAFCALEFARLMKFSAADHGLHALAQWRERMAQRPSAQAV